GFGPFFCHFASASGAGAGRFLMCVGVFIEALIRADGPPVFPPPAVFHTERAASKPCSTAIGREPEEKRDNRNGSSDCIDPAAFGPGADRGRNVGGAIFGRTGARPAATAESSRSSSTERGAGSEAGTCGTARSTASTVSAGSA